LPGAPELPIEIGDVREARSSGNDGNGQGRVNEHPACVTNTNPGDIPTDAFTNMLNKVTRERTFRQISSRAEL